MTSLQDLIARLRADLAAATPGPLHICGSFIETREPTKVVAEHYLPFGKDIDADVRRRDANARAHVSAVNAAPTMIDVVEAAARYREAVDARSKESNSASRLIMFSVVMRAEAAMFAALDRAEAEAADV